MGTIVELQVALRALQESHVAIDRRLIKISGLNGDNGQVSDLQDTVQGNTKKLEGLMLSRAALAGYAAASAGAATAAARFLF